MHELLQLATAALAANDAEQLESLCNQASGLDVTSVDRAKAALQLQGFARQLRGARQNVTLRERLFEMRCGETVRWER